MFHRPRDASKVALAALSASSRRPFSLLDVQFRTPHLASLGRRRDSTRGVLAPFAIALG